MQGENLRFISRMYKNKLYAKFNSVNNVVNKYRNNDEIAVRNFLKGLLAKPPLYNLSPTEFSGYKEIIEYITNYNPKLKMSEVSLSQYKHKNVKILKVFKTKQTESFVAYVKKKFKDFDEESFYGLK